MTAIVKKETALPLRNDTILGVCEALGQEFGVNANWFRFAFIAPLFFQPMLTIAVYFAVGAIIATTRWFLPRVTAQPAPVAAPATNVPVEQEEEAAEASELPLVGRHVEIAHVNSEHST